MSDEYPAALTNRTCLVCKKPFYSSCVGFEDYECPECFHNALIAKGEMPKPQGWVSPPKRKTHHNLTEKRLRYD